MTEPGKSQLATASGEFGMSGILKRLLTGWLSPFPFGLGGFPVLRRDSLLQLSGVVLVLGTIRAMRRQHVQLHAKRHFLVTDGANHKYSFFRIVS